MFSIFLATAILTSSPPMTAQICEDIREELELASEVLELDPADVNRIYNNCINTISWEKVSPYKQAISPVNTGFYEFC